MTLDNLKQRCILSVQVSLHVSFAVASVDCILGSKLFFSAEGQGSRPSLNYTNIIKTQTAKQSSAAVVYRFHLHHSKLQKIEKKY